MELLSIGNLHELGRTLIIYGLPTTAIIDTIAIYIASKKKINDIGIIKGWSKLHLKYGILETGFIKTILLFLIAIPSVATNPQFILLLIYVAHVLVTLFNIFFKIEKGRNGSINK